MASREEARAAKPKALEVFSGFGVVVGVGVARIGDGYGLKVNLREAAAPGVTLPRSVHGVPVRVEVVGPIRAR